ncbi:MAG TPA: nitrogen fixation protein FixH [Geobacter sp.]|nr:nitrogen fixation protein FixH [Geobacter sp.]
MPSSTKSTGRSYKIALSLMFGIFLLGMAATLLLSTRRGSRVVDAEYYNNGLHYGQTGSGARNPGLGWSLSASIQGSDLLVKVNDEQGAPVAGGKLFFQPGRSATVRNEAVTLSESSPGIFRAPRPAAAEGDLQGTLLFSRGEASASQRVVFFY